jgi:hypothetical protein
MSIHAWLTQRGWPVSIDDGKLQEFTVVNISLGKESKRHWI